MHPFRTCKKLIFGWLMMYQMSYLLLQNTDLLACCLNCIHPGKWKELHLTSYKWWKDYGAFGVPLSPRYPASDLFRYPLFPVELPVNCNPLMVEGRECRWISRVLGWTVCSWTFLCLEHLWLDFYFSPCLNIVNALLHAGVSWEIMNTKFVIIRKHPPNKR